MTIEITRRNFIGAAGAAMAASVPGSAASLAAEASGSRKQVRIVGVSCSPRKGKTTATSIQITLESAAKIDPRIKTEFIDLGGYNFPGWTGKTMKPDPVELPRDDFDIFLPMLRDPAPDAIIIGSPTYFRTMSSLCKAFIERLAGLRSPEMLLKNKPLGVLSVGAFRNGGQELVIEQIHAAMLCYEMLPVGGKPNAHQGATLWNNYNDDITKDEFGIDTAKKLGARVAEVAISMAGKHS